MIMKRYFWSLIQKFTEFFGRRKNGASVLMFHNVSDDISLWNDKSIAIKAESFEKLISGLAKNEAKFEPVEKLECAVKNNAFIITFDDMFLSAYKNALPVLEKNGIPYCVFISEKYIGEDGYISEKEIKLLSDNPLCTVGFHSVSHKMFRFMSAGQVEKELDCNSLTEITGQKPEYFAFPYGSLYACGYRAAEPAKKKYKYAFSTVSARCTESQMIKKPYYLPRINVNEENYQKFL